jgi:aminopeptidase N
MKKGAIGKAVCREEYTPYPWTLEHARFRFEIGDDSTRVFSQLKIERNAAVSPAQDIELDGQLMELIAVSIDGRTLESNGYTQSSDKLIIHGAPDVCVLDIEVLIKPQENTALEGLYPSGKFLLTQCEAEGFRKISYFPDRPDVMTRFDVTVVADKQRYPVLLSNGNAVDSGELENGCHWVQWSDPFAKPCYLFALVAGDLGCVEDHFVTRSGREVTLRFFVEHENTDRCDHAMESLIHSMKWDEERFGLEYDLDIYHVVATNDFNMGAMENKSLNIFNSKYVLARPDTATDSDYQGIEGVIGHEYFHNWTGNRVTCQDWFQLTLKEGLTVFRDQEFSSDMQSRAVKRIRDVRQLRSLQFPEDSTVYQKGAEIIRMYHTLLGEEGFQKGMKLYFQRHDGAAVTCDDFLAAMADANEVDLQEFSRWYSQSGTPHISAHGEYDPAKKTFTLHLTQTSPATHDQADKQPLLIPVAMGLLSQDGSAMPLQLESDSAPSEATRLLILKSGQQKYVFTGITEAPIPSLFRGFSAPVKYEYPYSSRELAVLMAHDGDSFVRWEAAQLLAQREILENVRRLAEGAEPGIDEDLVAAIGALLGDTDSDPALIAEAVSLPGEDYLADQMEVVDVDGIHAARRFVRSELARLLQSEFIRRYEELSSAGGYSKSKEAMAGRSLRNVCLAYLMETPVGARMAEQQLNSSDNMTDTLAALQGLVWHDTPDAKDALTAFDIKWRDDALVMDKWFSIQASIPGGQTVARVRELLKHPAYSITNPNKVRSVIGVFSMMNPTGFHAADGSGYRLHAEQVIALDALNPQIAARMVAAFNSWTRYDAGRRARMKSELQGIAQVEGLSPNVSEIIDSALEMEAMGEGT